MLAGQRPPVGCSGTGSPVKEQLARLSVGHLVLVDTDGVKEKNLKRILNSTAADAAANRLKVDVLTDAIEQIGLTTQQVTRFTINSLVHSGGGICVNETPKVLKCA